MPNRSDVKVLWIALAGVFVVATGATGFALALASSGSAGSAGFVARTWENALRYGWVNGIAVSIVFVVVWMIRRGRAPTAREAVQSKPESSRRG